MSITARQWLILLSVQFTTILFGLTATSVTVILPQLLIAVVLFPIVARMVALLDRVRLMRVRRLD